jgi:hypothetical protein
VSPPQDRDRLAPNQCLLSGAQGIDLGGAVRVARSKLPAEHRALLEQLSARDLIVEGWPDEVLNLYRTLRERPPEVEELRAALAAWLPQLRVVAFNGPLLREFLADLDAASVRRTIERLAWHEYGHALSVTRAPDELRRNGVRLLELLPDGLRRAIDYPAPTAAGRSSMRSSRTCTR